MATKKRASRATSWQQVLADLIEARGSQSEVARLLGVPQSYVSRWGRGVTEPHEDLQRRMLVLLEETHDVVPSQSRTEILFVRVAPETIVALDALLHARRRNRPGHAVHRSDIVREILVEGIDARSRVPPGFDAPLPAGTRPIRPKRKR